jgi:hypothetical protein
MIEPIEFSIPLKSAEKELKMNFTKTQETGYAYSSADPSAPAYNPAGYTYEEAVAQVAASRARGYWASEPTRHISTQRVETEVVERAYIEYEDENKKAKDIQEDTAKVFGVKVEFENGILEVEQEIPESLRNEILLKWDAFNGSGLKTIKIVFRRVFEDI